MSDESKCSCQRCGEHIEFPLAMAGQDVACPHCGRETILMLPTVKKAMPAAATPPEKLEDNNKERSPATKIMMIIIAIVLIIVAILIYNYRVGSLVKDMVGPFR